jgi:aspartate aminotransferase
MISQRVLGLAESSIARVAALAGELRSQGADVIDFGEGESDFETPDIIKEGAIQAIRDGQTRYTATAGILPLREAICEKLARDQGLEFSPDEIVVSSGGKHAIFNALMALVDPGDEVIVPTPFWVSFSEQVRLCGATPVFLKTRFEDGCKFSPAALDAAITPRTRVLILNSPNNPSGAVYTADELAEIAKVAVSRNIVIISDEVYEKLIYDHHEHHSIAKVAPAVKSRTVIIGSVSKPYAMTGWRIGFLASRELAGAVCKVQGHNATCASSPAQWAALTAIRDAESAIVPMRQAFIARRQVMVDGLSAIPGVECPNPGGAFYAFPRVSQLVEATGFSNTIDFCAELLRETHVACVPGAGFGMDECMRLSFPIPSARISEGLDRIAEFVNRRNQ